MKGGVLEVLLVNAEGLKHTSFLGNTGYYVVLQIGKEIHTSKITSGNGKQTCWNEKFTFKLSLPDGRWSSTHLSLRILERHKFGKDDVFGETMIHLGGFLTEGHERGHLEQMPAPYNIVAEDGTFEGEVKVGLRFIAEGEVTQMERREKPGVEKPRYSIYHTVFSLVQVPWLKLYFFPDVANPTETQKQK
ncbi:hypothetical protein H6P81_017104 [Aristolochia fimbriata]|uniref:C2 domain-containing protein n=1 Tax=Aristolochia fimbriata TaxID=158543 RepID=A0AAV7DZ83_ARIFI|nr:hypothetical protein H6P81_017104 [Aristolochia fimbriata]